MKKSYNKGKNNPMYGKHRHHTEETKEKMSLAKKGKHYPLISEALEGKKSPMFDKHHTVEAKQKMSKTRIKKRFIGESSPNWKGGKPHCVDCGKQLRNYDAIRCKSCARKGENHPNWKGGKPKCIDCGKELKYYGTHRCLKCVKEYQKGENSSNWNGGSSFEPYSIEFYEIRPQILERDHYTCQKCGSKKDIMPHHIDYNKKNNNPLNLVTLCRCCNNKMNANRSKWQLYWQLFMKARLQGQIEGGKKGFFKGYIKGRIDQGQLRLFEKGGII